MKKTAAILITAAVILSLTACSDETQSTVSGGDPITDKPSESSDNASNTSTDTASSSDIGSDSSGTVSKPVVDNVHANGEVSGAVFVLDNGRGIMIYGGGYENGKSYAQSLNKVKEKVGSSVNVFSLVAPTSCSFYVPEKYADMFGSEWDNIQNINENLSGVIPVDAYTALSKHTDEHIYSRTDHHWQPLGAYYAAEEFARAAKVPFAALDAYEKVERGDYVGTLYGFSNQDPRIKNNPEKFTYYIPPNDFTVTRYDADLTNEREWYMFNDINYLDPGDYYIVFSIDEKGVTRVQTDVGNGYKLLIVEDSYGNAVVPALTSSFEEIWIADMRSFKCSISDFVKENGITDVLFCMNTFSATGENQAYLKDII